MLPRQVIPTRSDARFLSFSRAETRSGSWLQPAWRRAADVAGAICERAAASSDVHRLGALMPACYRGRLNAKVGHEGHNPRHDPRP